MDLTKVYHDSDGNKRNILQMVKYEPEWAANVIQTHEQRIAQLEAAVERAIDAFWSNPLGCEDCPNWLSCDAEKETCKRLWRERLMGEGE